MKSKVEAIEGDDPRGVLIGCGIGVLLVLFVIFILPWLLLAFGWILDQIGAYWNWVFSHVCSGCSAWDCTITGCIGGY